MPRGPRLDAPGTLHHVMLRGIDRGLIFQDDRDRAYFVGRLREILPESGMRCSAWALMPNHIHLAVQTGAVPLPRVMARLNTGYAQAFNRRHDRVGYLFQNRYKSIPLADDRYFLTLVRYIHLNPMRAGLVASLDELARYPWAGHAPLMGTGHAPFQDTASVLSQFGDRAPEARARLLDWMRDCPKLEQAEQAQRSADPATEWAGAKELRNAVAGLDGNQAELSEIDVPSGCEPFGIHISSGTQGLGQVVRDVCARHGVCVEEIRNPVRNRIISKARAVIAYIACRQLGLSGAMVARELGVSKSAITQACAREARLNVEKEQDRRARTGHGNDTRTTGSNY